MAGGLGTPWVGEIRMVGFNFQPQGWMLCNGQLLAISQYSVLFNLIGTTYGGDGQSTFALPDLRGRVPLGAGQGAGLGNYALGQPSGAETVTLTVNQMAVHTHLYTPGAGRRSRRRTAPTAHTRQSAATTTRRRTAARPCPRPRSRTPAATSRTRTSSRTWGSTSSSRSSASTRARTKGPADRRRVSPSGRPPRAAPGPPRRPSPACRPQTASTEPSRRAGSPPA